MISEKIEIYALSLNYITLYTEVKDIYDVKKLFPILNNM